MRSDRKHGIAAALGAAFLVAATFASSSAHAFCRTATNGLVQPPGSCVIAGDQCCTVGKPLWWRSACVGFSLQQDASKQIDYQTALTVIQAAFDKWHNVTCPGGARTSIDFRNLGAVQCDQVQYNKNPDEGNANIIVFRDTEWDHSDAANTLGLTTVTFDPDTGELYDADMELNTAQQTLTVSPPNPLPSQGYDFDSIVTHEAGHFLGLAHSGDLQATMYYRYNPGSTNMRTLTPDDVSGVCSIYEPAKSSGSSGERSTADGGAVAASACESGLVPRHGFSAKCGSGSNYTGSTSTGCAVSPDEGAAGAASKAGMLAALGLALSLGVRRAKRRNSRIK